MHFIYGLPVCPPICPPLSTNDLISSSEENLNRRRKPLSDQKFRSYARQIGQQFLSPSSYANEIYFNDKDIDEEFDHISLSDIFYNSHDENVEDSSIHDHQTRDSNEHVPIAQNERLSNTKRILPGISNVNNTSRTSTIIDDGMGKTTNEAINNGKYPSPFVFTHIFTTYLPLIFTYDICPCYKQTRKS